MQSVIFSKQQLNAAVYIGKCNTTLSVPAISKAFPGTVLRRKDFVEFLHLFGIHTYTIILYINIKNISAAFHYHLHGSLSCLFFQAMDNRIFHKRLQHKPWHPGA